jgi:hypothetical protein
MNSARPKYGSQPRYASLEEETVARPMPGARRGQGHCTARARAAAWWRGRRRQNNGPSEVWSSPEGKMKERGGVGQDHGGDSYPGQRGDVGRRSWLGAAAVDDGD